MGPNQWDGMALAPGSSCWNLIVRATCGLRRYSGCVYEIRRTPRHLTSSVHTLGPGTELREG